MRNGRILTGVSLGVAVCGLAQSVSRATEPNFGELLDKARAEITAGHRLEPPGDNLADTTLMMLQLAPMATSEQLQAFTDLLDQDRKAMRQSAPPPDPALMPLLSPEPLPAGSAVSPPPAQAAPPGSADASPVLPPSGTRPLPPAPSAAGPAEPLAATRATPPAPKTLYTALPATAPTRLPPAATARSAELLGRGKAAEQNGDVSGARRFYAAAAALGNAAAARDLGRLYDPAFLHDNTIGGIDPDASLARRWYQRAAELGDRDAAPLLQALNAR